MRAMLIGEAGALLERTGVPGLALALVEEGAVTLEAGLGLADLANRRPVTTATTFQAASIAKTVTAWAVMGLVEAGRIGLDDPIEQHLKGFRLPPSPYSNDDVTIRRVMSHTAGLSLADCLGIDPDLPRPASAITMFGAGADPLRLIAPPGSGFRYSGGGWTLLQLMIQDVTGELFPDHLRRTVLEPLGMLTSSFSPDQRILLQAATPYDAACTPLPFFRYDAQAAAGLLATAGDLARFLAGHVASSAGPPGRGVLGTDRLALLMRPCAATGRADGLWSRYGFGYEVEPLPDGRQVVGHAGLNRGWRARIACLPDQRAGIALLCHGEHGMAVIEPLIALWVREVARIGPSDWLATPSCA